MKKILLILSLLEFGFVGMGFVLGLDGNDGVFRTYYPNGNLYEDGFFIIMYC